MCLLTRLLSVCTPTRIEELGGLDFVDSGEHLRKGMTKFTQLRPSLLDYFDTHGPVSMEELQDPSMVTGVAPIDGMELNSGELSPAWWRQ
jgi:hypothetical protein